MSLVVGTAIGNAEARARLLRRFPRAARALPWRVDAAYDVEVDGEGFVVRSLPRLWGSPLFEAVGRWRPDGGAEIELRPLAIGYMPLVVVNTVVLDLAIAVVLIFGTRSNVQGAIQGWGAGGLLVVALTVMAQVGLLAIIEALLGGRERDQLVALLRETLGS